MDHMVGLDMTRAGREIHQHVGTAQDLSKSTYLRSPPLESELELGAHLESCLSGVTFVGEAQPHIQNDQKTLTLVVEVS